MRRTPIIAIIVIAIVVAIGFAGTRGGDDTAAAPTTSEVPGRPRTSSTTDEPPPVSSTSQPRDGYVPEFESGSCEFDEPAGYQPQCGWLIVPEDRTDPSGQQVRLHVALFRAEDPTPADDPIVYLDGGPGGATLDTLFLAFEDLWAPFLEHGDLVFFDQRGVGLSEPSLDCPESRAISLELLSEDIPVTEALQKELFALADCRTRLVTDGIDLSAYDTAANAADVADLRIALEIDEWNLLGISYGTRLAQTVVRDYPEGVRSVILDSSYATDADLIADAPRNLDDALDHLYARCANDAACSGAYPDLEIRVAALAERLDDEPLEYIARNFLTGESYDVKLDGEALLGTLFQGLYSESIIPRLPEVIAEIERGETGLVSLLTGSSILSTDFLSFGMHLSVMCADEVPFTNELTIAEGLAPYPELAEYFTNSNLSEGALSYCAVWDPEASPPIENAPITTAIPVLVMAGSFDPITPARWGEALAGSLGNASFVEFPTLGHGTSIAGECPNLIALAFFSNPEGVLDTSCIVAMDPVAFVPEPLDPADLELVEFDIDLLGTPIRGVVPRDWDDLGTGAWARANSGLDQTSLVQQAFPPGINGEIVLSLFGTQLGLETPFEQRATTVAGAYTWEIYESGFSGFTVDIAIAETDEILGVVLLITDTDETDQLRAAVFEPVLDAFDAG